MNRYILIRRLRGPAFLLLVGALALLNQADILSWGKSWPFYLILAGVFALAERAALAAEDSMPLPPYPGAYQGPSQGQYPGAPYPGSYPGSPNQAAPFTGQPASAAPQPQTGTAIVPSPSQPLAKNSSDFEGGQS
jgi:hypothetical protein